MTDMATIMKPELKSVTTQVVRNWRYRERGEPRKKELGHWKHTKR